MEERVNATLLVVYAPNEDQLAKNKDEFWDQMVEEIDDTEGIIIIGDLNSRVWKKDDETKETIWIHGKVARNNNGKR